MYDQPSKYQSGYKKLCPLDIKAPAEMLESVAGYADPPEVLKELSFAIACVDENDSDTLRWVACLIERRLIDMGAA